MRFTLLLIVYSLFSTQLSAQANDPDSISSKPIEQKVIVKKDYGIDKVISTYRETYKKEGYRIQIYSGNKKQPAKEVKAKYIRLRKTEKAHEIYQQPYFKVRIGDFRTKIEALKFQEEIIKTFPNSYIVKDEIDIELLNNK